MDRSLALILALALVAAPLQGCLSGDLPFTGGDDPPDGGDDGDAGDDGTDPGDGADGADGDGSELPPLPDPRFNGTRAFSHVEAQVLTEGGNTRHRIPGTDGSREVRDVIVNGLHDNGWTDIDFQRFNDHYVCEETQMVNVVGTLFGNTNREIILGAHYDTRPWSDADPNVSRWDRPTPGANDGGSGVAGLLELARVLKDHKDAGHLNHTIKLAFFDAEDGGDPPDHLSDCDPDEHEGHNTPGGWVIGSTHYVTRMDEAQRNRTEAVIVLDLVGDENLTLQREGHSYRPPHRELQDRIWRNGQDLGYDAFRNDTGPRILDDHHPFQQVGIQAVDVIHLDDRGRGPFPDTWHTTDDTVDHVSTDSLEAVGRTVELTLYELDAELGTSS